MWQYSGITDFTMTSPKEVTEKHFFILLKNLTQEHEKFHRMPHVPPYTISSHSPDVSPLNF